MKKKETIKCKRKLLPEKRGTFRSPWPPAARSKPRRPPPPPPLRPLETAPITAAVPCRLPPPPPLQVEVPAQALALLTLPPLRMSTSKWARWWSAGSARGRPWKGRSWPSTRRPESSFSVSEVHLALPLFMNQVGRASPEIATF